MSDLPDEVVDVMEPPWVVYYDAVGVPIPDSQGSYYVAFNFKPEDRRHAERAVHAVNCHASLVSAVQSVLADSEARLRVCDVLSLREALKQVEVKDA